MKKTYDHEENLRRNLTHAGVNSKLQFVTKKLQDDMRRNFERSFEEACHIRNRQVLIWWAILQMNPTIGIRTVLNRNDITATFAGPGVVAVTQCRALIVKQVYHDHNVNGTCYAHTPVITEQNEIYFMISGTTDLIRSSTQIDCERVIPAIVRINDTYTSGSSKADVTQLQGVGPMLSTQLQKITFNSTDVFDTAKGSSFPLALAISYGANLAALQQYQNDIIEILMGKDFAKEKHYLSDNSTVSEFFEQAVDSVFTSTKDWIVSNLLEIGLIPALIGVAVLVGIVVFKLFFFRRALGLIMPQALAVHNVNEEHVELREPTAPEFEENEYVAPRGRQLPFFTFVPLLLPAVCAATTEDFTGTLPFIPISLEDRGITALWDSGASISYARISSIRYLGISEIQKSGTSATTANGTKIKFLGRVNLGVRIGNIYLDHEFLVSEDNACPAPVLLGTDFMRRLESSGTPASLNLTKGTLQLANIEIKLCQPGETVYKQTSDVNQLLCCEILKLCSSGTPRNVLGHIYLIERIEQGLFSFVM